MLSLHKFYRNVGFCIFKRNFSAPVAPFASHVSPDDGKADEPQVADSSNVGRGKKPTVKSASTAQAAKSKHCFIRFALLNTIVFCIVLQIL